MADIVERLRAITGQAGDYGDVQLCDAAADEIERLLDERRWIAVSERLPEWGQFVIVAYDVACGPPEREVGAECHYADGVWTGCDKMRGGQPTHWMPMPEPPAQWPSSRYSQPL